MSFVCSICSNLIPNPRPPAETPAQEQAQVDFTVTKCGHLFHTNCLDDWFNRQNIPALQCPNCNSPVATAENRRVFPSGDEETEVLNAGLRNVRELTNKNKNLELELAQLNSLLFEALDNVTAEQTQNDVLKYEMEHQENAIQRLDREKTELEQMLKATEDNSKIELAKWQEKTTNLETTFKALELAMVKQQADLEKQMESRLKSSSAVTADLESINKVLRTQMDFANQQYKKFLRRDGADFMDESLIARSTQTESPELQNVDERLEMYQSCISHLARECKLLSEMTLKSAADTPFASSSGTSSQQEEESPRIINITKVEQVVL